VRGRGGGGRGWHLSEEGVEVFSTAERKEFQSRRIAVTVLLVNNPVRDHDDEDAPEFFH
jgi:hypothetical protein